jgi:4-amino-4-deoxy-L-arabinose transferase-like glycosyltransferase
MEMSKLHLPGWLDWLWIAALGAYVLLGVPMTTFHGDEAMQIYTSHDYVIAFIERDPLRLQTAPPYPIDSDAHLRILNGTVNRYLIGLSWHLAGLHSGMLPPRPGWDWGLSYDDNVATGHRPVPELLTAARLSSALFFAASIGLIFALARLIGGRGMAYIVSALYALNPALLLNGRRAMQEGSLLFFGLLTVLTAAVIAQRRARGQRVPPAVWLGLTAAGALGLASKHNTAIFVAGAFAWIALAEIANLRAASARRLRRLIGLSAILLLCAVGTLAGFIALSPALWNDPIARLGDLLAVRAELLDIQVGGVPTGPMPLAQRLQFLFFQPFAAPLMQYEVSAWNDAARFQAEAAAYLASPLSGLHVGVTGGVLLTAIALVGVIALLIRLIRGGPVERAHAAGLLIWLLVTMAALLANPLPWQRYYLPLMPISALLAGIGVNGLGALVSKPVQKSRRTTTPVQV